MKFTHHLIFIVLIILPLTFNAPIFTSSTSVFNKYGNIQPKIDKITNSTKTTDVLETPTFSDNLTNYILDLVLNSSIHYLTGTLILDYVNNENININRLYFHLYPNAAINEAVPGCLLINTVKTKDQLQDLDYSISDQLLNLTLPYPLLPAETFSLRMEFETAITNNESFRLCYKDDPTNGLVYALCNYYPILAVFDDDGWNLEPQYFIGDPFYSDVANYFVNLTVPSTFIVASSGKLVGQGPEFDNQIEYQYQLLNARDFSFAISPDYITENGVFNSILINIYYLPRDAGNWSSFALDVTMYSLELYTNLYGSYPYSSFAVATTFGFYNGMEWPGLIYIETGNVWFETTIAHEIAHQWFYAVVGNDQIDEGFLDEGIVCYNHWYYSEERYGWTGFFEEHLWRTANTSNESQFPEGLIINRSINYILENNLNPNYYWEAAYHKAPSVLHLLRTYIGDEYFFNGLRRFYSQYSFQIATFMNLIECFNYFQNIDWFLPWFNEGFIPRVELVSTQLEDTTAAGYNLSITVKQSGVSVYPAKVPFRITLTGGEDVLVWIWSNTTIPSTSSILLAKKPLVLSLELSSGYLYPLNLLELESIYIQDNRGGTNTSVPGLATSTVVIYLILFIVGFRHRKT